MECCCLCPDLTVIPLAQGLYLSHLHPPCQELIIEPVHTKFSSGQEGKISQLFLSTVVVCIMPPPKVSMAWSPEPVHVLPYNDKGAFADVIKDLEIGR